jgi:hypothetical protein
MAAAQMYTFVTVVFEDELDLMLLQARSMQIYGARDIIEKIWVIDNSRRGLPSTWLTRLLHEYGDFASRVQIIRSRDLASIPRAKGWTTQQILKLAVSKHILTDRYVLLDCKNHLVHPLTRTYLEAKDGKPRTHLHSYSGHPLRKHLERVLAYYRIPAEEHVTNFSATATPFVMYTAIVREMIKALSAVEGVRFEKAFANLRLTEFFSYASYIIKEKGGMALLYDLHQQPCPCIWEHSADRFGCETAIAKSTALQTPFFAVHRLALSKLSADAFMPVASFWSERGLFANTAEAASFLRKFQGSQRRNRISLKTLPALIKALLRR